MSPTMKPTKRRVFFAPENDSITIIKSRVDFSKKEKDRYWYSQEEKEAMHNRCLIDVERFESQGGRYKRSSHIRGLEGMTTKGRAYLEATILACIDAVMDEQEAQWDHDYDDYERLAKVSQDVSAHSTNIAIERAITDEKEARTIYRQDKQNLSPPTMPVRKESNDFDLCFEDETASTLDATNFTKECSGRDSTHVDLDTCCKTRVFYPITISNTLAKAA